MVTKHKSAYTLWCESYVLAKIQMVTKPEDEDDPVTKRYVLAKIQMVTKPQINIIII